MDWQLFYQTIIGSGVVVGLLVWLARGLAQMVINKEIERYKATLNQTLLEHEVQFRRIDIKKEERLCGVFERLYDLYDLVHRYIKVTLSVAKPRVDDDSLGDRISAANEAFRTAFFRSPLYIPDALWEKTSTFYSLLLDAYSDTLKSKDGNRPPQSAYEAEERGLKGIEEADDRFTDLKRAFQVEIATLHKPSGS
jgi:hypothetical protein